MQLYSYTTQFADRLPFSQHLVPRYRESPAVPPKFLNLGGRQKKFRPPKLCTKFPPLCVWQAALPSAQQQLQQQQQQQPRALTSHTSLTVSQFCSASRQWLILNDIDNIKTFYTRGVIMSMLSQFAIGLCFIATCTELCQAVRKRKYRVRGWKINLQKITIDVFHPAFRFTILTSSDTGT